MNQNFLNFNIGLFNDYNNILLGIINDLQQIINNSNDNIIIQRSSNAIIQINNIINDNKKNTQLIINHITLLQNQITQLTNKFDELKINSSNIINNQELYQPNGRYVGQVVNGIKEGKGIMYYNDGDKYEGDWRNVNKEGKGIYYVKMEIDMKVILNMIKEKEKV